MASAPWNDLLNFDAQLDETERQVRDSIRSIFDQQLVPGIIQVNRHEKFEREGTHDVHALIPGRGQTGIQAFS